MCGVCGRDRHVVGHHFDYRRPFAVVWLCPSCHARAHREARVKGRCAGCGVVDSLRVAKAHVRGCPEWARLYREDRARALEPGPEYERWLAEDKQAERDQAVAEAIAEVDAYRAAQAARFAKPRDILEEDDGE